MVRNILIISSDFTGHGHKSITTSLCEEFDKHPGVKVHVIDGFSLGGNVSMRIGKMYGSVTRNAKDLWKLIWDISLKNPDLLCDMTEVIIKDSFLKILRQFTPDLILSVHPSFNGSIINILEKYNLNIPFVTLIADLISITPLWCDKRADYILCPTIESKEKCLEFGIPESKLKITGFPIRSRFFTPLESPVKSHDFSKRPIDFLIMSGGEGSGNMTKTARILLNNFDCRVKIIAGRNKLLKRKLENQLCEDYEDRVKVFGFIDNGQDVMRSSDIAFTRGSPNTLLEAVYCNVPIVVTGALPGQEERNPDYLLKYNLGTICKEPRRIRQVVEDLVSNNCEKLLDIKEAQAKYADPGIPEGIVNFILNIEAGDPEKIREIPDKKFINFNYQKINSLLPLKKLSSYRKR